MKKVVSLVMILSLLVMVLGCQEEGTRPYKLADLYIAVMEGAYLMENGGNDFIAINISTLENLNEDEISYVMEYFSKYSDQVVKYQDITMNEDYFVLEEEFENYTKNGTVLSVTIHELKEDSAKISGVSWFGMLGAIFPEYKATYKNGKWELEVEAIAIS